MSGLFDAPPDDAHEYAEPTRDAAPPPGFIPRHLQSLETEQALLGAILMGDMGYGGVALDRLPASFTTEAYAEPVHGRIHREAAALWAAGSEPDPLSIYHRLRGDPALEELGAIRYLADLVDRAPPSPQAPGLATVISDLYTRRRLLALAQHMQTLAGAPNDTATGAELVLEFERALDAMASIDTALEPVTAAAAAQQVEDHLDNDDATAGMVMTGLAPLDNALGGCLPGDCVIIAGRTGMGKSTLANAIMLNIAGPGIPLMTPDLPDEIIWAMKQKMQEPGGVISFNGEMPVRQTTWRMLSDIAFRLYGPAAPTFKSIRSRKVSTEQRAMLRDARAIFDDLPLVQLKRTGLRLAQIRAICRRQAALWKAQGIPLRAVIIDHAGLLNPEGDVRGDTEAQSQIARGTKALADDLGCPIFPLVQLNRKVEERDDKQPQVADLRSSGQWEENADAIILCYREAYYAQRTPEPEVKGKTDDEMKWSEWDRARKSMALDAIVGKCRDGEPGRVQLWADVSFGAVRPYAPEVPPAPLLRNVTGES